MTYAAALDYLHGLAVFGARFGLETTQRMAAALGHPQGRLRFIHVAGTNGKGSTCAMLESVYRAAGLRVGLFTSPHLVSFRERIQINRQLISEADVARLVKDVRRIAESVALTPEAAPPTFFEFVTVLALKWFAEQHCDLVILETGLGGRLDATNIVMPLASVITNISFDHQQWLGDTLAKIAAEKAGIIKPGVPVFTAADAPEAVAVIRALAVRLGAPFTHISRDIFHEISSGSSGTPPSRIGLRGAHQGRNAALAVAVVKSLQSALPVGEAALQAGLANVRWAGRLQIERVGEREFILDGAHNPDGIHALVSVLRSEFANQRIALVIGILADKDYELMCRELVSLAPRVAAVRVNSNRSLDPKTLAGFCQRVNPAACVTAHESVEAALASVESEPRVVIAGSLYLIGEALERLGLDLAVGERGLNEWQAKAKPSEAHV